MGLLDFINNGNERRRALDAAFDRNVLPLIPPELRSRLGLLAEMNPVVSAERAGTAAQGLLGAGATPMQRVGYAGDMLSNMAGIAAPAMVANRAGMPTVQAIEEGLLGFSQAAGVPEFIADESGALRLFHGSPHDFDRFSMDKIGTGEGAQAYGHGLYFAENEGVARGYRDALSGKSIDGKDPTANAWDLIYRLGDNNPETRAAVREGFLYMLDDPKYADFARKSIDAIDSGAVDAFTPPGRMYEVNIDANPEDFLDWDKPLSEQPQKVREWFDSRGISPGFAGNQSGAELMQAENSLLGPEGVAAAMREAGVPGIKYLDHGSRFNAMDGVGPQTNTRNYVIFDENLISIVRKYGFAGAAALLGMSEGDLVSAANAQGIDTGTGKQMALPPPRGLLE